MFRQRLFAAAVAASTAGGLVLAGGVPASADTVNTPPRVIGGDRAKVGDAEDLAIGPDGTTYAMRTWPPSVRVFAPGARGNDKPLLVRKVRDALSEGSTRLETDTAGRVYVVASNDDYTEIKVYAPRFAKRAPLRTLIVNDVGGKIAVSPTGEVAFLPWDRDAIEVYARDARGKAEPSRVIKGPATGLVEQAPGVEIAIAGDGRIWASNLLSSALAAFAPGARGNVAPTVRINGPRTGLSGGAIPQVDAAGRVYAQQVGRVSVFAASASGDVAPLKVRNLPQAGRRRPGLAVSAKGDMVASVGQRSLAVWRTLFPTRASKVRAVRVTGKSAAAKRTVRWKKPSYDGGRAVQKYKVVIRKGSKVLRTKSLKPDRRSYVVKKKSLRRGKLTVTVRAKTSMGWSPKVVKRFRVR